MSGRPSKKMVLILGAGASYPYGFPLGKELVKRVLQELRWITYGVAGKGNGNITETKPDTKLSQQLYNLGFSQHDQERFRDKLKGAHPQSIDAFLFERGEEFGEIGKASIAIELTQQENLKDLCSLEYEIENLWEKERLRERWYWYLLDLLGSKGDFLETNLSVITFNYDRSLEYFIFHTIKNRFAMSDDKAAEAMTHLPIVHMYGCLGQPYFLDRENGREYSDNVSTDQLRLCMKSMNLMFENQDDTIINPNYKKAHDLIASANNLVFLGFGYHEKNLERLRLRENYKGEQIFAGFYKKGPAEIERDLRNLKTYSHRNSNDITNFELSALNVWKQQQGLWR